MTETAYEVVRESYRGGKRVLVLKEVKQPLVRGRATTSAPETKVTFTGLSASELSSIYRRAMDGPYNSYNGFEPGYAPWDSPFLGLLSPTIGDAKAELDDAYEGAKAYIVETVENLRRQLRGEGV